jgi:hypothetical protein
MTTVIGADPLPQRPEDIAAAKRRKLVQDVFAVNKTKDSLMEAMAQHSISVTELAQALDYTLDAIAYLRDLGVPDGFMGLKVWPQADLDKYYEWQAKTPNALNLQVGPPPMYMVQQVMDREFSNNALSPAHKIPWSE